MARRPIAALLLALAAPATALALVPREPPVAGTVVGVQGDEQLKLVHTENWLPPEVRQQLQGGDLLTTGPYGGLALLFADRTQVRVARNSTLLVKQVGASGPSRLRLERGTTWSHAVTHGHGLDVETPAATVSIRGTEWSLAVDANGRSTLTVIEGSVQMSNAQGAVTVGAGEAAIADIGRAPEKTVLIRPELRPQFLLHLEVQYGLAWLPLVPEPQTAQRAERARLAAIPEAERSAAQWEHLALLETDLGGFTAARAALAHVPKESPAAGLVAAYLAIRDHRWDEAAQRAAAALPGLSGHQRLAAGQLEAIAELRLGRIAPAEQALQAARLAAPDSPYAEIAQAWLAAYRGDLEPAAASLAAIMHRHPDNADAANLAARVALLLARAEAADAATAHAVAIDPESATAWFLRGSYLSDLAGRPRDAIDAFRRAVALAPERWEAWNGLGIVLATHGGALEGEQAFRTAHALAPKEPEPTANLITSLLGDNLLPEAEALMAELPDEGALPYTSRGKAALRRGQMDEALEQYLAASAVNPADASAQVEAAVAYYQIGDLARAQQSLASAERADPSNAKAALIASGIAVDRFEADDAILQARETTKRLARSENQEVSGLAVSREGNLAVGSAFTLVGLTDWARYYNDLAFSPFDAGSQFARSGTSSNNWIGYALAPLSDYARNRYHDFQYRPYTDVTVTSTYGAPVIGGRQNFTNVAQLSGYANDPVPYAYNLAARHDEGSNQQFSSDLDHYSIALGTQLSARTGVFIQGGDENSLSRLTSLNPLDHQGHVSGWTFGIGHYLGDHDVLLGVVELANNRYDDHYQSGFTDKLQTDSAASTNAGVRRLVQYGDTTLSASAEWLDGNSRTSRSTFVAGFPDPSRSWFDQGPARTARGDLDLLWRASSRLQVEGGMGVARTEVIEDQTYATPRFGIAWRPDESQMLRLAVRRDPLVPQSSLVAPADTVGLIPNPGPVINVLNSDLRSLMTRWDKEWTPHLYTAALAEHYEFHDPAQDGELDRLGLIGNVWINGGFGLAAAWVHDETRNTAPGADHGRPLALVPDESAAVALTWVHPSQVKATLAQIFAGSRAADSSGTTRLAPYTTTHLAVNWETWDRHLGLGLALYNLFDEKYELLAGAPAEGRGYIVTGSLRF